MKQIIFGDANFINFEEMVGKYYNPIFAKRNGKLCGMIVYEPENDGWITRIGGGNGLTGYHGTLSECIKCGQAFGYEYFVEDE